MPIDWLEMFIDAGVKLIAARERSIVPPVKVISVLETFMGSAAEIFVEGEILSNTRAKTIYTCAKRIDSCATPNLTRETGCASHTMARPPSVSVISIPEPLPARAASYPKG